MDKCCILVTGFVSNGKSYFMRKTMEMLSEKYIVDRIEMVCAGIRKEETLKEKIKEYFEKTGVEILFIETHPPYIFSIKDPTFDYLQINLALPYIDWKKHVTSENKNFNILLGNIYLEDVIAKCIISEDYFKGLSDGYYMVSSRKRDEHKIINFDNADLAVQYIVNYIDKNISNSLEKKKKEFKEITKIKLDYLSPGYTVFQYQSFNYGKDLVNIGMSDPVYKWDRILKLGNIVFNKKSVLDIGCNIGEITYIAALKGANATGIEYDDNFYKAANFLNCFRKRPVEFIQGAFMEYDFKDRKFDIVFDLATSYLFLVKYKPEEIFKKIRSITKELYIAELTYNENTKDEMLKALKSNFSKVEYIGDSFRTDVNIKQPWGLKKPEDKSNTRQVWHCYV